MSLSRGRRVCRRIVGNPEGESVAPMLAERICIDNLNDLRELVYQTLCGYDELEPGIFPMTERILVRGGKPCGILFSLRGPRRVSYTSVWETETNSVLFYGSSGERFAKLQLQAAPVLAEARDLQPT
jgi:hypothetical protein